MENTTLENILRHAIIEKKVKMVELALQKGADFNKKDEFNNSAVYYAIVVGIKEIICQFDMKKIEDVPHALLTALRHRQYYVALHILESHPRFFSKLKSRIDEAENNRDIFSDIMYKMKQLVEIIEYKRIASELICAPKTLNFFERNKFKPTTEPQHKKIVFFVELTKHNYSLCRTITDDKIKDSLRILSTFDNTDDCIFNSFQKYVNQLDIIPWLVIISVTANETHCLVKMSEDDSYYDRISFINISQIVDVFNDKFKNRITAAIILFLGDLAQDETYLSNNAAQQQLHDIADLVIYNPKPISELDGKNLIKAMITQMFTHNSSFAAAFKSVEESSKFILIEKPLELLSSNCKDCFYLNYEKTLLEQQQAELFLACKQVSANNIKTMMKKYGPLHMGYLVNITDYVDCPLLIYLAKRDNFMILDLLIILQSVDINIFQESSGISLLHIAAGKNKMDLALKLLQRGINVNAIDHQKRTALRYFYDKYHKNVHLAGSFNQSVPKILILSGALVNKYDNEFPDFLKWYNEIKSSNSSFKISCLLELDSLNKLTIPSMQDWMSIMDIQSCISETKNISVVYFDTNPLMEKADHLTYLKYESDCLRKISENNIFKKFITLFFCESFEDFQKIISSNKVDHVFYTGHANDFGLIIKSSLIPIKKFLNLIALHDQKLISLLINGCNSGSIKKSAIDLTGRDINHVGQVIATIRSITDSEGTWFCFYYLKYLLQFSNSPSSLSENPKSVVTNAFHSASMDFLNTTELYPSNSQYGIKNPYVLY